MHRVFLLSIFLTLFFTARSQITRYTVWDFRDSLRSVGIDSFIIYSKECTGELVFGRDSCSWQEPYYLMWRANNKFYVKKFELCYRYKILELDSLTPYQYYFDNKKAIDSEEIKPFAYTGHSKTANGLTSLENTLEMQYDCFYKFSFSIGSDIIEKKVSEFNLTKEDFYVKKKNKNYSRNQETKLKHLLDLSKHLVIQLKL